jgi:hypothetical protein
MGTPAHIGAAGTIMGAHGLFPNGRQTELRGHVMTTLAEPHEGRVTDVMPQREPMRTEFFSDFLARDSLHWSVNLHAWSGECNTGDGRVWHDPRRGADRYSQRSVHCVDRRRPPANTFSTFIHNTDLGSNAGIPDLSIPRGSPTSGLPVGLEIDGPLRSDNRLIGVGLLIEAILRAVVMPAL